MNLLDTNVILRFLVADNPKTNERVNKFFLMIESGKITVDLELTVLFEVIYVLQSFYKREKKEIHEALSKIVDMKNLRMKRKEMVKKTLSLWKEKNIGLVDSQLIALSVLGEGKSVYSFDKDFDKFKQVKRIEP